MNRQVAVAWMAFDRVKNQQDQAIALVNAQSDLEGQRDDVSRDGVPALNLTCTVETDSDQLVVLVESDDGDGRVRLSREVIAKANAADIAPLTLVACALASPAGLDHTWRPRPVGGTTQPKGAAHDKQQRVHRHTEADREIEQALRDGLDVILRGDYGAGKTATATTHAKRCMNDEGYGAVWLDLTDPADGAESLLAALLVMRRHDRYLILVDSVQANPPAFEAVQRCVRMLRKDFGLSVQILATGWPRLVNGWREPFKDFKIVTARTEELIRGMLDEARIPAQDRARIMKLIGLDVHLAVDAVDFYREHGRVASWSDLQSALTEGLDDDAGRQALYWFASLGFFGLDASANAVTDHLDLEAVNRLVGPGLLAHTDGRYSIPSHARARLALRQAMTRWDAINKWGRPEQLAWEHMQRSGERVIKATLGRLDLVGVSGNSSAPFNASTRYLARAWDLFAQMARALARRCDDDPTWGDNMGAAVFAAQTLVVMDYDQVWQRVAAYLRNRWRYDSFGVLPAQVGEASAEAGDFDRIQAAMTQEDKDTPEAPHVVADPADTVNLRRFYQMWMLGSLLGFEGTALHSDPPRLNALLDTAEREVDAQGFFEPRRVPWVTARMIIGLCQAGEGYQSSEAVRAACDWLRRPVSDGGPFDGGWHSGTGAWNTPEATTAMCITALLRAHAPADTEVAAALLWLKTREDEWTKPGREIDLALVLEAMLLGDDHQKVYQRVLDLLAWAQRELKRTTPDDDSHIPEAGLRTPFVAAQLASFVWATVIREYKVLMRDLIQPMEQEPEAESETPRIPASRTSPESGRAADGETLVEPRPNLPAWRAAIEQLDKRILGHLRSLDNLVRKTGGTEVTRAEIAGFRKLQRHVRSLADQVGRRAPAAVLIELDRLGRNECGVAWPDLEVPAPRGEREPA